ncbi:PilW family protein [Photobacterium sanguinicancri]|uniref:PilW family protein n=1 Tax=Photobacterium sanguinicancri TaxID=875932 RepID=UPI0021C2D91B|nr:prepilin-type N-terminal cleavage/methylation domain-containing protein [Photobacterium sanguinicancri]MDO6497726.1 prepilin-type N-terminal cleavage/methylation domain-containing protein [Photobacterium sanguinicancri]
MHKRLSKGFSLIELMISSAIGLGLITVVTSNYFHSVALSNQQVKRSILSAELDSLVYLMSGEIKRAGYCGDCKSANGYLLTDATGANKSSIAINDSVTALTGTCIRFAYNEDSSLGVLTPRDGDARGYRLKTENGGKTSFEIYRNYNGIANWSCNDGTHWLDYQNDMISISKFDIQREEVIGTSRKKQNITITLTGNIDNVSLTRITNIAVNNVDY